MVVATKGATIVELKPDGTLKSNVTHGHYRGVNKNDKGVYPEVWGCAVHPSKHLLASCGSDYTVRIWDSSNMLKISEQFTDDMTSIDWSPDAGGKFLAVGDRAGKVHILETENLKEVGVVKAPLAGKGNFPWIEVVRFSPDGSMIAFGSHGGNSPISIAKIAASGAATLKKTKDVTAFSSAIVSIDWSLDGQCIVANT